MDLQVLHKHFIESAGICTDSRKIVKNQLFFALSGQNFNGNQFANQAIEQGAKLAIIDDIKFKVNDKFFLVSNVLDCLQQLALFHRKQLNTTIVSITGTNGKTTTKELISKVLQKKYKVTFTQGNLNNHIGVPLTLLSFTSETEIGVVEMGANHPNEISQLCNIALPDFGIINNIGKAHLEGFGSFEGVIKAKSELYDYCKANNKKVFVNGDDSLLMDLSEKIERITYGKSNKDEVCAEFISANPLLELKWKEFKIQTQLVGEYNFNNVLAAIAVGIYFQVPDNEIGSAISEYQPQNNRSQLTKTADNTLIIDAYNANPSSMELAVRNFMNINASNKLLILGDMFELGEASEIEHQKIIDLVKNLNFEKAFFVGKNFFFREKENRDKFNFFISIDEMLNYLSKNKIAGYTILLKASRGIQLEKVFAFL
jgi:UDP-N-acetylmuramoyl-tripeptide--D-alanyl-D-alanine ligase